MDKFGADSKKQKIKGHALRVSFAGANKNPKIVASNKQDSHFNYLIGNDPKKWQKNLSSYLGVTYKDLYPGIDLTYKGKEGIVKYEFKVAPGGDPGKIKLKYEGAKSFKLDKSGNLRIKTSIGEVKDRKPFVYQIENGKKKKIEAAFKLSGNTVYFALQHFDKKATLFIDPGLEYGTYMGGNDDDYASGIAVDSSGSAYITGESLSSNFPTPGGYDTSNNGGRDAFVAKFSIVDASPKTRYEETSGQISYMSSCWSPYANAALSGGAAQISKKKSCTATFSYTGKKVEFISAKDKQLGKAKIYVDNVYHSTLDLYSSTTLAQKVVYARTHLSSSAHTLKVEVLATKDTKASDYYIPIDAFDVTS